MDYFLKSLLNLLHIASVLRFGFFGSETYGILAPQPGIKPAPVALESQVLSTGPPGKSFCGLFLTDNSLSQVELLNKYLGTCSGLEFEL